MNRRAKLNLGPDQAKSAKQQTRFAEEAVDDTPDGQAAAEGRADQAAWDATGAQEGRGGLGALSSPNTQRILKTVVVVAVAGLTLYLLKRRFF
jgi:hypothetical protein